MSGTIHNLEVAALLVPLAALSLLVIAASIAAAWRCKR